MNSSTSPLATRAVTVALLLATSACTPDVGPCDPFAAREIVYLNTGNPSSGDNGTPMFAGQALIQTSCGDGQFCHANTAEGRERYGVPVGLDFDFSVPCDSSGCVPGAVQRLRANQEVAFDARHHILQALERSSMPPGRLGATIRDLAGTFVRIDTRDPFFVGGVTGGEPLPEADSRAGRQIISNWLACGLPVVERHEVPNTPQDSGRNCRGSTDCVYRVDALAAPPQPHWPSIYETVIQPFCGNSCHGEGEPDFRVESQLDLGNIELAYQQMVNRVATGDDCIDGGATLIVPGDAGSSLLVDKMQNREPSCGDPMPSGTGALVPAEFMAVIRQWVDAGAPDNCYDATFDAAGRVTADNNELFTPAGAFTLEAWVAPTTATSSLPQRVIAAHHGLAQDDNQSYVLALNATGQVEVTLSATGNTSAAFVHPTVLTDRQYHHVAMMLNVSTRELTIFVDGVPETHTLSGTAAVHPSEARFTIGDYDPAVGAAPFSGVISDVRLSGGLRYVLADGQTPPAPGEALFTPSPWLLADADTVAHYPLHAAPGATTARDVSGNALHATVVGGVTSGAVACR